jgi:hypothetical protein
MNLMDLSDVVNRFGFSFRDLLGQDRWESFTPVFGSLTVIGATTYLGRVRYVGKSVEGQVSFMAATSIASVAGTDYLSLPIAAGGVAGFGVMTNDTTNIAVGLCHLDPTTSRLYLPTQAASANTFTLFFKYEVA